jgi:superfamily II DNA or RNA helicase
LLGNQTVHLLEILDLKQLTPNRLAELVMKKLGAGGVLLNRTVRQELILSLSRVDAERLCRLLQVDEAEPWQNLKRIEFRRAQTRTDVLFSFFGLPALVASEDEAPSKPYLSLASEYPLFSHQRLAYRQIAHHLASDAPRVLLHMPTGAGKTRTAMNAVCEYIRLVPDEETVVLWLAHSEELCDQAAEEFERAWQAIGNRELPIFRHYGSYRVELSTVVGGFLVSSLQLLYRQSLSVQSDFLALGRRARLIVIDEAHQAIAPTYHHLLSLLAPSDATALLGLSATPGRSWLNAGEDLQLADFFYHQKVSLPSGSYASPIEYLQAEGFLAKVDYTRLPYAPVGEVELTTNEIEALKDGFDLPERVIEILANDEARNLLVLHTIMTEGDAGSRIIVFACSVAHATMLASILELKGYRAAAVTATTPTEQRRNVITGFRQRSDPQILCNFGVLTTGFDAPKANCAVVTRPTHSVVLYSQMIGRVMRGPRAGGNTRCKVYSVVDQFPGFRSAAEAFGYWEDIW